MVARDKVGLQFFPLALSATLDWPRRSDRSDAPKAPRKGVVELPENANQGVAMNVSMR
jgi:hypothetical protein